jgi:hypothetical protein
MSGQQKKQDPIVHRFAARLREVRQGRVMNDCYSSRPATIRIPDPE